MTTLGDLRTKVYRASGYDSGDSRLPAATVDGFVNRGLQRIARRRDWPWMEKQATLSLVPGEPGYDLPDDWSRTVRVSREGRNMRLISPRRVSLYGRSGSPRVYYIEQNKIWVVPMPLEEEDLTHVYFRTERHLTADAEEPWLPDRFDDVLVTEALKMVADMLGDSQRFARVHAEGAKAEREMNGEAIRSVAPIEITTRVWPV